MWTNYYPGFERGQSPPSFDREEENFTSKKMKFSDDHILSSRHLPSRAQNPLALSCRTSERDLEPSFALHCINSNV